ARIDRMAPPHLRVACHASRAIDRAVAAPTNVGSGTASANDHARLALASSLQRAGQVAAAHDLDALEPEPRGHARELGAQRGGDGGLADAALGMRGLHAQRAGGAIGFEIDARDELIAEQERQHVVTVYALLLRRVDLEPELHPEHPLGALAHPD